jgi:hypothetical protein
MASSRKHVTQRCGILLILKPAGVLAKDRGAGHQTTLIIPSHDLVVVRLGHYKGSEAGEKGFKQAVALLMDAVPRRK